MGQHDRHRVGSRRGIREAQRQQHRGCGKVYQTQSGLQGGRQGALAAGEQPRRVYPAVADEVLHGIPTDLSGERAEPASDQPLVLLPDGPQPPEQFVFGASRGGQAVAW